MTFLKGGKFLPKVRRLVNTYESCLLWGDETVERPLKLCKPNIGITPYFEKN